MSMVRSMKPRLVFFQWDHRSNANYSKYMMVHTEEHLRCLQQFFDVVHINYDCDFGAICDQFEPSLVLFEGGYQLNVSQRIQVRNTRAHRNVPRVALYNADPWSPTRSGFYSDMEEWGAEVFFSICTTAPEYMHFEEGCGFTWPNFIDSDVFRDYGCDKSIPIMLTGQRYALYPWRQRIFPLLSGVYPCLTSPQFGYADALATRALKGVAYARALNASWFAPACGTMANETVRKHFEIPASKACLIAEKTPSLVAAGFRHLENCVFADEHDVLDVLDSLFAHVDELQRITEAGHALVHSRHTMRQRAQIHQWFELSQRLNSHQRIVQRDPFGDLELVPSAEPRVAPLAPAGLDRALLRQGNASRWKADFVDARRCYDQCIAMVANHPEALFGLAMCHLMQGDAASAASILSRLVEFTTADYGAADPDPIDLAALAVSLICQAKIESAARLLNYYPAIEHSEIDHVRNGLKLFGVHVRHPDSATPRRRSVHDVPERGFDEWKDWLGAALLACHQPQLASIVRPTAVGVPRSASRPDVRRSVRETTYQIFDRLLSFPGLSILRPHVPPTQEFAYLQQMRSQAKRVVLRSPIGATVRRLRSAQRAKRELAAIRASANAEEHRGV